MLAWIKLTVGEVWAEDVLWVGCFFLSRRLLYVLPERGKANCILNSFFSFFSGAYYISRLQNNRMTASHLKIFFFFLEPQNPCPKINNL